MNFSDGYAYSIPVSQISKARELMKLLDIPIDKYSSEINITTLYEILMDEEKFAKIVSVMKNKAFW
jgi:hypothetical protein